MKDVKIVTTRDLKKMHAVRDTLNELLDGTEAPRRKRRKAKAAKRSTKRGKRKAAADAAGASS